MITGYPFESDCFSETGINLIRGMNVKRGYIDLSNDICVKWTSSKGLESYLLKENDIIIQMDGALIGKSYGIIKKKHLPALLVQRVTRARINNEIADSDFMYQTIQRDFLTYISMNKTETAVPHLSLNDIKNFGIMVPTLLEQKMIGSFFANLDRLITLHQRKCETLKKLKKSMLQKMFPKNGSHFPEIRFAGFTDAWEQRKFSDFTFPAGERNKDDLDLEPFAITSNQGFIAQSEAHDDFGYMKDVDRKMYIVVKPNSFAYNPARINVGSLGYYEGAENVIVSSLYEVFQTAEYVDDKFLKHWFKTKAFQDWIERLQEGSVRLYFYYDKLCECIMSMPSVEEQRKIGAYLDKIDNLITLHQRKLETLKKLKKAMLQKMFI